MHLSERTCRSSAEGMQPMLNLLFNLLNQLVARARGERGEVSIEYVLVGGMMAVAIIAGITALTGGLDGWFDEIAAKLDTAF